MNLQTLRERCGRPLISVLLTTLSHLGTDITHQTVWLTAAEICSATQVFPKLNLLTNHSWYVLDMQIDILLIDKLGTVSKCHERQ